jgi:hypothetical protein
MALRELMGKREQRAGPATIAKTDRAPEGLFASLSAGVSKGGTGRVPGGLAGWLLARLRNRSRPRPRLALLERIALAPRQSLALVEAEGRRILVATSAEGGPAFYPLDDRAHPAVRVAGPRGPYPLKSLPSPSPSHSAARVSW